MQGSRDERSNAAIGQRLIATRLALGFKVQSQFAKRAGVAPNTYNQYEKGISRPRLDEAIMLADKYDLTLDWIYLGDQRRLSYELVDKLSQVEAVERR